MLLSPTFSLILLVFPLFLSLLSSYLVIVSFLSFLAFSLESEVDLLSDL